MFLWVFFVYVSCVYSFNFFGFCLLAFFSGERGGMELVVGEMGLWGGERGDQHTMQEILSIKMISSKSFQVESLGFSLSTFLPSLPLSVPPSFLLLRL